MATVLVTGGTGMLGRALVPALLAAGHEVRVLSRLPAPVLPEGAVAVRGDLSTGAGMTAAAAGVQAVVHAGSNARDRSGRTDVTGTERLLDALAGGPVEHLLYVSIVGIDRNPFRYYRAKLAAERAVMAAGVPWSVVRATQFHEFVEMLLATAHRQRLRLSPVPRGWSAQPVATEEVARFLVELLPLPPRFSIEEYAGPRVEPLADLAATWQRARGIDGRVVRLPVPGRISRAFRSGSNLAPEAARGRVTFAEWLTGAGARERPGPL